MKEKRGSSRGFGAFFLLSRESSEVMFDIYGFVDVTTIEKTNFLCLFRDFYNEFSLN